MCLPWRFGMLKSGMVVTAPLSYHMTGVSKIFLQRPAIAILLHRISHVAHCVYILTKALPLFILLLKLAYVELMVGEMEACTRVTCIAKSNNGSMEMTNQTSWSRLCTYVEGGWWNEILLLWISLHYLDIMRTWLYLFLLFLFFFFMDIDVSIFLVMLLGHAIFLFFFFDSPCLIWRILERERDR